MFKLARLGFLLSLSFVMLVAGCSSLGERKQRSTVQNSNNCIGTYKVVRNDSLSLIAQKCKVDMGELARLNDLHPPYIVYPNQDLVLPSKGAVAQPRLGWQWPVKTYSSYRFVQGSYGVNSLEIYGSLGEAVHAVAAGEVIFASLTNSEFGKLVMVRHSKGYMSVYAHNSNLLVRKGDKVKKGQIIASLGDTGEARVPMLLFEARLNGKKVRVDELIQPR